MQKRTKLAIVLLIGLILLAIGLYFFFSPYLENRQAAQPPALPASTTPTFPKPANKPVVVPATPSGTPTPVADLSDVAKLRMLENKARTVVERVGSGSNNTGFLGYEDVALDFTSAGQAVLKAEQAKLVAEHPARAASFGISTRVVSSHIRDAKWGDASILATVQAIQSEDAGNARIPTKSLGKKIEVTFLKQADGLYLIESLTWTELPL